MSIWFISKDGFVVLLTHLSMQHDVILHVVSIEVFPKQGL
jgi:hypothetical protein